MKKTILHIFFSFFACILSLPASAQGIPVLAGDPDVTRESLPDGITCYLVPNPSYKGLADFALVLQGRDVSSKVGPIGTELPDSLPRFTASSPSSFLARNRIRRGKNGYVQSRDGASVVRFENVRLPAGEPVIDSLLLLMFDLIDVNGLSGQSAVIISGDIDRDEMLKKLRILSLMVPGREGEAALCAEPWAPRDSAFCSVLPGGSPGTASLTVSYVSPRTPAEYMSTALPAVSERLSDEFRSVLLCRLSCRLRRDSVPAAGITYSQRLSSDAAGPEQRSVTILTSDTCVLKAASSAGSVFSSLCGKGAELDEYVSAKSMALAGLGREAGRPLVPNSFNVDRCVSSFLYGNALVSAAEKLRFHQKGELPDTCGLRLFNSFISELADSSRNLILTCRTSSGAVSSDTLLAAFVSGWRSALSDTLSGGGCHVNMRDTMRFPVPVTRASLRRTRTDSSTGTSTWTFSNGMKVIYRKMPTSGRLFYSFVLRGGYSSMRNMKDGEGAFLSDMLGLYEVCGVPWDDFRRMLAVNDVSVSAKVSLSDIRISGSLPQERLSLLMKSLLAFSSSRSLDTALAAGYMTEERIRLKTFRGAYSEKRFVLDSIANGGDRYSAWKSAANLRDDLPARADRFFRRQFSEADDGYLIFVGEMPETEFRKRIQEYVSGFTTVGRRVLNPVVSFQPVSGESTYFVSGDIPGVDMLMSAEIPMNAASYMSAQIASMVLEDALEEALHDSGMRITVRNGFSSHPQERFTVSVSAVPYAGGKVSAGAGDTGEISSRSLVKVLMKMRSAMSDAVSAPLSDAQMEFYRTVLRNSLDSRQSDPAYWVAVISDRFSGGKDVQRDYDKRISEVDAAAVRTVLSALDGGSKIEYVTKPKKNGSRNDNPDR